MMEAGCDAGAFAAAGPVAEALFPASSLPGHCKEAETVATTLLCLTEDTLAAVLLCLSARDIFLVARTCRRLMQSSEDDARLWQPLCSRGWASKTSCEKWISPIAPQSLALGTTNEALQQGYSSCSVGKSRTSAGSSSAANVGAASRRRAGTADDGPDPAPRSYRCRHEWFRACRHSFPPSSCIA